MTTRITLDFYGDTQLDRTLVRMRDAVTDATPVWRVLADRFGRMETRQFATEGAYGSGGWPALSPQYAAWKSRHWPGAPILERTGALRDSLTRRPFGVEEFTPGQMTVGSNIDYGLYHQKGDGVPRRRPVEFPESERREWTRTLQRFVVTGQA